MSTKEMDSPGEIVKPRAGAGLIVSILGTGGLLVAVGFAIWTTREEDSATRVSSGRIIVGPGGDTVQTLAWSPDGEKLAIGGVGLRVRVLDKSSGRLEVIESFEPARDRAERFLPWSLAGASLWAERLAESNDGTTPGPSERAFRAVGRSHSIVSACWSPDGKTLAVSARPGGIELLDLESGSSRWIVSSPSDSFRFMAFSPDGRTLLASERFGRIRSWDVASGEPRLDMTTPITNSSLVAYSPDGRFFALGGFPGPLRIWDASRSRDLGGIGPDLGLHTALEFSPDGRWLATAYRGGIVRIWDLSTGREIRAFPEHGEQINALAWSPDGRTLASGGSDGSVRLFDMTHRAGVRRQGP